nr:hypothetical protein Iba_chr12eCG2780 [Ipomoea batatas]
MKFSLVQLLRSIKQSVCRFDKTLVLVIGGLDHKLEFLRCRCLNCSISHISVGKIKLPDVSRTKVCRFTSLDTETGKSGCNLKAETWKIVSDGGVLIVAKQRKERVKGAGWLRQIMSVFVSMISTPEGKLKRCFL